MRLHVFDEFLERFRRHRNVHTEYEWVGAEDRDTRQVLEWIVVHLLHQRESRELRGASEKQRVAVGRGLRDELGGDRAACADPVLDDELLAERYRQPLGDDSRLVVGDAARGVR